MKYGKNRALTFLKIITGIPKILIRINQENRWLKQFLATEKIDAVISDNRYGLYSRDVFSVFITHQLFIKTSAGRMADRLVQRINYRSINRFSLCWVPDHPENGNKEQGLAGDLSHPQEMPVIPTRYIGLLSRMEPCGECAVCDLLILLSGPEPQRTILEKKILEQLPDLPGSVILVRGLPGGAPGRTESGSLWGAGSGRSALPALPDRVKVYDHLPGDALNRVICGAGLVISRPGYSSVMDLLKLGKKCVFIPTPGQTEQEYLGEHLAERKLAICLPQRRFTLSRAVTAANHFPFTDPGLSYTKDQPQLDKEVAWLVQVAMDLKK